MAGGDGSDERNLIIEKSGIVVSTTIGPRVGRDERTRMGMSQQRRQRRQQRLAREVGVLCSEHACRSLRPARGIPIYPRRASREDSRPRPLLRVPRSRAETSATAAERRRTRPSHRATRAPARTDSEVLQLLGGLRPCGVMPSFSGPPRRSSKRGRSAAWVENARRGTCGRVCLPRRSRECTPGTTCNGISSAFLSWCSALARFRCRP